MLKEMLEDYVPVLLHVIVAVGFATVTLLANLSLAGRVREQRQRMLLMSAE